MAALWVWKKRERLLLLLSVSSMCVLIWGVITPVRATVEMGTDEHYELTKAGLWVNGHKLYQQVWDDQPPLHTALLGFCFQLFGPSIGVARATAVSLGMALLAGFWVLVEKRSGRLAAFLAAVCLLAAPQVFVLALSTMLEVPAVATTLWALWPIWRWQERAHSPPSHQASPPVQERLCWLVLSGAIVAIAVQVKLTAAVVAPALAVELLLGSYGAAWSSRRKSAALNLAIWSASAAAGYIALCAAFGHVPFDVLWGSHFSAQAQARSLAFSPRLLLDHTEALWAGGVGLLLIVVRKDWRRMAFPLVWLLTATLVHLQHRPWWPYYYLHFAVPLAWLAGYAVAELFRLAWARTGDQALRARLVVYGCLCGASLLVALIVAYSGDRLLAEIERIRALPRVEESALIAKMRQYAPGTRWVYTRQTIYPFHAGLLVIPELAVLPAKRFWSGQITQEQIWATVKRYRPEQLLVPEGPLDADIRDFVEAGYRRVYEDGADVLYVAKSLAGP